MRVLLMMLLAFLLLPVAWLLGRFSAMSFWMILATLEFMAAGCFLYARMVKTHFRVAVPVAVILVTAALILCVSMIAMSEGVPFLVGLEIFLFVISILLIDPRTRHAVPAVLFFSFMFAMLFIAIAFQVSAPISLMIFVGLCAVLWRGWRVPQRRGEILIAIGRQVAALARRGLPLVGGLEAFCEQAPHKTERIARRIVERMREGQNLSEAMEAEPRVFPYLYVSLVRAGERSGTLDLVMDRLAEIERFLHTARAKLQMRMLYPCLVGTVLFGLQFRLFGPQNQFAKMFQEFNVPLKHFDWNYILIFEFLLFVLPLLALALLRFLDWIAPEARAAESLYWVLPWIGRSEREMAVAHFSSILAAMAASGAPTREVVEVATRIDALESFASRLDRFRSSFLESGSLALALDASGPWPGIFRRAVENGESTGALVANLDRATRLLESRAERRYQWIGRAVVPVVIPLMGCFVFISAYWIMNALVTLMMHIG